MTITPLTEANRPTNAGAELAALRRQHRALDATLRAMEANPSPDELQIARVKKRALALRDRLRELEGRTTPDLIA
jgi:hypothetical protein